MAKKDPPELPIRVIRERGRVHRLNTQTDYSYRKADRTHSGAVQKDVITHRTNEVGRNQSENLVRRKQFRDYVTTTSLARGKQSRADIRGEQFRQNVFEKSGGQSASVGATAGIIRIFVVLFLLSMLFLLVSRGDQAGTAIQKIGYFMNNLTSSQPLFKTKAG